MAIAKKTIAAKKASAAPKAAVAKKPTASVAPLKPIKTAFNKTTLQTHLAEVAGVEPKVAKAVLAALEATIVASMSKKGLGEFTLPGLLKITAQAIPAKKKRRGIDPFTKKPVYIARQLRDRKLQRALMQFFKPENYFEVREALQQAKRTDLIGDGCDSLIPSRPPREALKKRQQDANQRFAGNYVHTPPGTGAGKTPKPGRQKQSRREGGQGYRPKGQ